jgi:NNP family nitrate/nitrite transporter-like MFS transporter
MEPIKRAQLPLQTVSLVAGFTIWVIISSLMPFIKEDIALTASQISLVTAIPVILGSVLRFPIGFWTNRFGARWLFSISFLLLIPPLFFISQASTFLDLVVGGFFIGISGAIFSVGVTSLPKYYPKEKHGLVNGIYGMGNIGTAVTTFLAPVLAVHYGWSRTVQFYIIVATLFAILNFLLGDRQEPQVKTSLTDQLKGVYKNNKLWILSLFYFITFGSFVAFTVYLPNFLVAYFHLSKVDAGIRTAVFIVIATLLRPVGGWLGDKFNPLKLLMLVFAVLTISGILLSFSPTITLYTIGCLSVAVFAGLGNGLVFKLMPHYFMKQMGIANGIVSAMGGLGGFFPPLLLTMLFNYTGHYAIGFMALSEVSLASMVLAVWLYAEQRIRLGKDIINSTSEGIMVTNINSVIQTVNPAFTRITGYREEEVVGKTPRVLRSGKQDEFFYKNMWEAIKKDGFWQGEIWNKRKNGEIYKEWLTISAVKNESGVIDHYVGMFSDLTKTKKVNKEGDSH